ncbi:MAG: hypothetical protein U9N34_07340 [Candidatus Cloacimonadota bacterium]|nr:hypothetical protein [Candidatus Cloacimonadota bacterium]
MYWDEMKKQWENRKNDITLPYFDKETRKDSLRGFGETKPITSNLNPKGRAQNRRTEFVIVDK